MLNDPGSAIFVAWCGVDAIRVATVTTTSQGLEFNRHAELEDLYVSRRHGKQALAGCSLTESSSGVVKWDAMRCRSLWHQTLKRLEIWLLTIKSTAFDPVTDRLFSITLMVKAAKKRCATLLDKLLKISQHPDLNREASSPLGRVR